MPKEKVWDDVGLFDLEVGWSSTGEYVQVGIITHDGRSLADWLTENKPPKKDVPTGVSGVRLGDELLPAGSITTTVAEDLTLLNVPSGIQFVAPDPHPDEALTLASFNSLWSSLSRSQINRLIRILRKARDESYGKDE